VDGHVQEDPTGRTYIGFRRRRRVAAGDLENLGFSDSAGFDDFMYFEEIGVEPPIEAHHQLDTTRSNPCIYLLDLVDGQVDGFLAEDMFPRGGGIQNHLIMRVGGSADGNGFHIRPFQHLLVVGKRCRNIESGCHLGQFFRQDVGERHYFRARDAIYQVLDMDLSNPTRSQDTKPQFWMARNFSSFFDAPRWSGRRGLRRCRP
jgi:hypothetical protein